MFSYSSTDLVGYLKMIKGRFQMFPFKWSPIFKNGNAIKAYLHI